MVSVCRLSPAEGTGVRVGLFLCTQGLKPSSSLGLFGLCCYQDVVYKVVLILYSDTILFQNTRAVMLSNA